MISDRSRQFFYAVLTLLACLSIGCSDGAVDSTDDDDNGSTDQEDTYCDELDPEGNGVGQVAANWTLVDADGNEHSLHDYCGKVVYLEIGPQW